MPKLYPVIKKTVISAVGAVVNFPARQSVGLIQGSRLEAIIGRTSPGFTARQGETTVTTAQRPAARLVSTSIDMTSRQWVNVGTESAGSDWEDPANHQGAPDGAHSTLTEGVVLTQGTLIGDFPDFVNKAALTITKVELVCHYSVAQFLLAGTTLQIQYRNGALGLPVTVKTISGGITSPISENHLSGETFDITAAGPAGGGGAWTWAALNGLQVLYAGTILVDLGLSQVVVDASRLIVTATLTEAA